MTDTFIPREWQRPITRHIVDNQRCAVWASMGSGKTSATLQALDVLSLLDDVFPALILGPKRVAKNVWPKETKKWAQFEGMRVASITGDAVERQRARASAADVYTTNYDNLVWLREQWGDNWPYRTVVSDESTRLKSLRLSIQTSTTGKQFVRGQGGLRARSLGKIIHTPLIKRFIELTGTPAPNGLQDLWGQMWFLDGGQRLGRTYTDFSRRWFERGYDGFSLVPKEHAQEQIQNQIKDLCLTVDIKDYLDINKPITSDVRVYLPPKARRHYREMERRLTTEIDGVRIDALAAAQKSQKCLQAASGFMYADDRVPIKLHEEKLDALESIVAEWNGESILVAYQWAEDLAALKRRFPKGRVLDAKQSTEDDWNAGKISPLFVHPQSAGHGLNLQLGGRVLVYYSHWWNSEERDQVLERIGPTRQFQAGLDRAVYVYNIIAADTLDEDVVDRTTDKSNLQSFLMAAMKRRA